MEKRWEGYKNSHNNPKQESYNMTISGLMREYGFDNFWMEEIETIEVEDESECRFHEGQWQMMLIDQGYQLTNERIARGCGNNMTEYRKANPESYQRDLARLREKVKCDLCGKTMNRGSIWQHQKKYCPNRPKPKPKTKISIRLKKQA
jgi:hypothetical protein